MYSIHKCIEMKSNFFNRVVNLLAILKKDHRKAYDVLLNDLFENGCIYLCSCSSWNLLYFSTNINRKLIIRNPQDTQIILIP